MGLLRHELIRNEKTRELTGLTYLQTRALMAVVTHALTTDGPVTAASVTELVSKVDGLDAAGAMLLPLFRTGWLDLVSKKWMVRSYRPRPRAIRLVCELAGWDYPGIAPASHVTNEAPLAEVG
ncbi:MAG TPA: hypothetical protein VGK73_33365 [Polyangiaceae bacterium]